MTKHVDMASLRQIRGLKHKAMVDLVGIGGSLNADQQASFDGLAEEVSALDRQILVAEQLRHIRGSTAIASVHSGGMAPSYGDGAVSIRTKSGALVATLGQGDPWPRASGEDIEDIEASDLSLGRTLRASVTGDWTGAETEREIIQASMRTNVGSHGGFLVPGQIAGEVIDLARAQTQVLNAGARIIPMESSSLSFATIEKDPVPGWRAEGKDVPESEMNFGMLNMQARTLAAILVTSVELMEDAANFDSLIKAALAQSMASQWDWAALMASGQGPEPAGLTSFKKTQKIDLTNPDYAALGYKPFSQAYSKLLAANVQPDKISAIYNSDVAGTLDQLVDANGQPLQAPPSWSKMKHLVTNQIPTDTGSPAHSWAALGDFSQMFLGLRTDLTIEVTRVGQTGAHEAFSQMKVLVRAYMRGDVALARENHFALIRNMPMAPAL